jgi:hypothetical protein
MATALKELETLAPVTNGGAVVIEEGLPFVVEVSVSGSAPLLFHRWNCEAVEEKSKAKKGSKAKKSDDIESYVYRNEHEEICLPGEYLRQSMCYAAKFKQDPRSPRKSAFDLFKAGIAVLDELCPLNGGTKDWDYLDQRRVTVQRNGITRVRPAFNKGWTVTARFTVLTPEYIDQVFFHEVLEMAGRLIGVGDFRPTYGRFQISNFQIALD